MLYVFNWIIFCHRVSYFTFLWIIGSCSVLQSYHTLIGLSTFAARNYLQVK